MGWLRKIGRKIGKVIKKVGKGIKKGLKGIAKGINKLGIVGTIAMMFIMPYVPVLWTNLGTFASGLTASSSVFAKAAGYALKGIYHAGKIGGKIYSTVTNAITGTLARIPGVSNVTEAISKTFNNAMDWTRQKLGIGDPTAYYSKASLDYKEFQNVMGSDASLKDFEAFKKTDGYAQFKSINKQGSEFYNSMQNPSADPSDPSRQGTFGKTDTLRKNETFDDFLERNNMEADRFLELNDSVPTIDTTMQDGTILKTPELNPLEDYNVIPSEKEVIGEVRRLRLGGETANLEYEDNMYKITSDTDRLIRTGLTPEEAYSEVGRKYQAQFGDSRLRETLRYQSEYKGYARDGSSGDYFKQDQKLLDGGAEGIDAVSDMTIVTPESDPNFFKKLSTKVIGSEKVEDLAVNLGTKAINSTIDNAIYGGGSGRSPDMSSYYSFNQSNKLDVRAGTVDLGMNFTNPSQNIGTAQFNAYTAMENSGYGGNLPSYQSAGYFGTY